MRRVHRDPLEIALVAGAAGDRVPVSGGSPSEPRGAELAHGSGVERVAQSERAEAPERGEREVVEREHRRPVAAGWRGVTGRRRAAPARRPSRG